MRKQIHMLCATALVLFVLLLGTPQAHAAAHTNHPACGANCSHDTVHTNLSATSWSSGYVLSGDRYLTADQTISRTITVSGTARLCLNGHTMTFAEGYGLYIETGGKLELCDCVGTGGIVRGTRVSSGDSSIITNRGSLTVYSGQYCTDGEGVSLYNDGTLTVYGGTFGIELSNYGTAVIYQADIDISGNTQPNFSTVYNASGCSLTIYDGTFQSYGYALNNQGTATIRGGTFRSTRADNIGSDCVYNKGWLYLYGADISAVKGDGINNEYDSGRLYVYGGTITASAANCAAIYNRNVLSVSGGTLGGYIGIHNGSALAGSNKDGGTCEVSGGTVSGTLCGIRNSGNTSTSYTNGVAKQVFSRAILEVNGSPTISKIILEYPDAFTFLYRGAQIIDLEIDLDYFKVGDTAWDYDYSKVSMVNLQNEGYVLQYAYPDGVVLNTDACGANGDNLRWELSGDGVLTIYGKGDMADFGFSTGQPWNYSKTQIHVTKIVLERGVTSIGTAAFSYLEKLTELDIPEGVTRIRDWSLEGLDHLQVLKIPSTVTYIGNLFASWSLPAELQTIVYNGCSHQWAQITISSNCVKFTPICKENTNKDDGNCLTALLCSVCGGVDVAARETHTGGTATCTALAQCEVCGTPYGDYGHVFDQQVMEEDYLKESETCETAAVYYLSCACGEKGSDTFTGPAPRGHVFDCEVEDAQYLLYEATCEEGAYYFKSCVCGLCGDSDVFQGAPLGHDFADYADNGDGTETAPCVRACGQRETRYRTFAQLFPDANFRAYVTGTVLFASQDDKGDDARLTDGQMASIRTWAEIELFDRGVTSLEGIGLFRDLRELMCILNDIEVLDLSGNAKLEYVEYTSNGTRELNISGCAALKSLFCGGNQLTALDLSGCTALEFLDCRENQLSVLDVRLNTALTSLDCSGNQLETLDLKSNPGLEDLVCYKNRIAELDVSGHTALRSLTCVSNGMTRLNLSGCTNLETLYCAYNELTHLDLSEHTALITVDCGKQTPQKTAPAVVDTGRGWTLDMAAFLGENGDPARVAMTDGGVLENGVVTYAKKPTQVTYCYDTGVEETPMDVAWTAVHGPVHVHIYDQHNTAAAYLRSAATCTAPAVYATSCTCGEAGGETFPYGGMLPHVYDRQNTDEIYLKTAASCTAPAFYVKSCACGEAGEETFAYGGLLPHVYDQTDTGEAYLKTPASCTKAAFYYKSCICGEAGTSMFVSGDPLGHDHGYGWEDGALVYACSRCGNGRTEHLTVGFNEAERTLAVDGRIPEGMTVWAAGYDSHGRMTALAAVTENSAIAFPDAALVQLFTLDAGYAPATQALKLFESVK